MRAGHHSPAGWHAMSWMLVVESGTWEYAFIMATTIETRYEHIVLHDGTVPLIANTTMKVVELVTAQQAYGWSPEELVGQVIFLPL